MLLLTATVAGLTWSRYARARRAAKAQVQVRRPVHPSAPIAPVKTTEAPAPQSLSASKPRVLVPLPPAQVNLPSAAVPPQPKRPTLPTTKTKTNGKPLKLLNGRQSHRRKIFDYNRYFADLMSTVSGHTGSLEITGAVANPVPSAPQAYANGSHQPANGAFRGNSELIASQTAFIEEQRRLIQEQTRVIEEKTKLIAEKNQLLKMQTEMLENKLL